MRLILVRHGEPVQPRAAGEGNPPLAPAGHRQAAEVAACLRHEKINAIVHSGMHRAAETAAPLVAQSGAPVEIIEELGEIDRWGGGYASLEAVKAQGPAEWDRFMADPLGYYGIDEHRFVGETLAGLDRLFAGRQRQTLAVFTHGFPINIILREVLGTKGLATFAPAYGSITRLTGSTRARLAVVSINETGHLARAPARAEAEA